MLRGNEFFDERRQTNKKVGIQMRIIVVKIKSDIY